MSNTPSSQRPPLPIDFEEGGAFHHEIVGELEGGGSRVIVVSTDAVDLHSDGPVVYSLSSDFHVVFYRKGFLDKVWEFVEAALQGTKLEAESEMRMVGAVLNRAIMALYQSSGGNN